MKKLNFKKYITSDLSSLIIFICFWIILLGATKTPFSGIHFQDDHQIIQMHKDLISAKVPVVLAGYLKNDLKLRFRPFYIIHRIIVTKVLGTNLKLWSFYTGFLAILTSFFLYKFLRLLQFSFIESLLFSFLSLLGPHACIWWKLGNNETIGAFLLSISLFFLSKSICSKHSYFYKSLTIILLTLTVLSKESFILFIPAVILIYIFFSAIQKQESYKAVIKKNYIFIFILSALFILPLIYIFRFIGTNSISYAGMSNNYLSIKFIKWFIVQIYKNLYFIILVFGFFLLIQNESINSLKSFITVLNRTLRAHFYMLAVFFAILIPQCLLYFKSGLETRYFMPFVIAFSLLIVYVMRTIRLNDKINNISKFAFTAMVCLSLIVINFRTVIPAAREFSNEGLQTKALLNSIIDHTDKKDTILFVLDPGPEYEWGFFLKTYFETGLGMPNIHFLPVSTAYAYPPHYVSRDLFLKVFSKYLIKPDSLRTVKYSCIAVLPDAFALLNKEYPYLVTSSKYTSIINPNFNVYYLRKN